MINIILCGSSGTRLWPLSRTMLPKQFVRLFEGRSLFQDTVLRNQPAKFLLEPVGRNTVPAIALACLALEKEDLVFVTTSEHLVKDQSRNLMLTGGRQITLVDVDNLLIVGTSDALLISKKGSSQKVKQVVAEIKNQSPELAEIHRLAHRPWGTYDVLQNEEQYKVNRIVVKSDSKLFLQKHFHRNEHRIVVSGTATVTVGEYTGEDDIVRVDDVYNRD